MVVLTIEIDKEVYGYYVDGLTVPDDITLLWCDDKCVIFQFPSAIGTHS